ncbi:hypothetical protein CSB11_00070 [Candidatus Campbellbacteria bacterium]|nr:MAG: hypothetical protein CSB11_00070 [Candidatus Campbellbacteria bacterium]
MNGTEVISTHLILNWDFIYYLIYLFFKSIFGFILNPFGAFGSPNGEVGLLDLFNGGFGQLSNGYSLFFPPHGGSFGGFSGWLNSFFTNPIDPSMPSFFDLFFGGTNAFIYLFIILLLVIYYILSIKSEQLDKEEEVIYDTVYSEDTENQTEEVIKAKKWKQIIENISSANPSDWKMAVMDADNLLEETLIDFGYEGESLGEILKNSDFQTLQNAWAGHKIRNEIAHNFSYNLTQQEAKRAVANFSKVFAEFYRV